MTKVFSSLPRKTAQPFEVGMTPLMLIWLTLLSMYSSETGLESRDYDSNVMLFRGWTASVLAGQLIGDFRCGLDSGCFNGSNDR